MKKTFTTQIVTCQQQTREPLSRRSLLTYSLVLTMLLCIGQIRAQYSGTISVPNTTFTDLGVLIDSLNQYGLSGNLTVSVTAAQTAPTDGYNLGSVTLNTSMAGRTLVFNGGGNVITAQVGTRTTTSTVGNTGAIDFMWGLRGTDNVTINNFVFTDPTTNNTTTMMMEAAVACFNWNGSGGTADGCKNIFVTNNTFNFQNLSTYSNCIWVTDYLRWSTGIATWSTYGDRHSNINITGNTMNEGYNFCVVKGSTTADQRTSLVRINNNNLNRVGGGTTVCYGVTTYYTDSVYMNNNIVVQDSNQATTSYVMYPYFYGRYGEVKNNQITLKKNTTTAITNMGIYSYFYNYGSNIPHDDKYYIIGNNIDFDHGSNYTTTTGGTTYGIYSYNYAYNLSDGTNKRTLGTIDSNTIVNDTIKGSTTLYGLFIISSSNPNAFSVKVRNNRIENIVRTGFGGTNYLLYTYGFSDTAIYENNIFNNFRYTYPTTSATSPSIYPFYGYFTVGGVKPYIRNNTFSNIGVEGLFSGTVGTFYNYSYGTNLMIHNNKIHNYYVNTSSTGGGSIYGWYFGSTTDNMNFYNNVIDSLRVNTTSTSTTGTLYGIYHVSGGTNINMYNNYIGDFFSPSGSSSNSIFGLYISSTPTINFSNNTILFGRSGALTSSSTSFGAGGIYFPNSTSGGLTLKNNIIHVNATPGSSSNVACIRRASGTHGTKPVNFLTALSNNNTYYTPSGTRNYYYCEGTSTSVTNGYTEWTAGGSYTNDASFDGNCSSYKNFMQGERATASNSETWVAGAMANTYMPSGTTLSESSGEILSMTTPDLNNISRGSAYDRGALQFSGTAVDIFGPTIVASNPSSIFCTTAPALTATITDYSGINSTTNTKPRLYYKKSSNANAFGANNSSVNGWKWVEPSNGSSPYNFVPNYSLLNGGAPTTGDYIVYFFAAQDLASTPNVSVYNAGILPATSCPTSVDIGSTSGITGIAARDSFLISTPPTFGVQLSPDPNTTSTCMRDTITHQVIMSNPGAAFPTYSLGTVYASTNLYWDVDTVQIGNFINASACAGGGSTTAVNSLPASVTNRYSNYTSMGSVTDLFAGNTYPWKVVMNNSIGNSYNLAYSVFCDYNRNGTFELPAEMVATTPTTITMTSASTACGPYPAWQGTFTVPATGVTSGPTLFRVVGTYSTVIPTPTTAYTYGETEDYMVNIVGVPSNATHSWTSNQTGTTVLGTTNPFSHSTVATTTYYADTVTISGCPFIVRDTVTTNPLPTTLMTFNATQCGGGIPNRANFRVRDLNGFSNPTINWFSSATSTTPIQSGIDTAYLFPVTTTTTFWVSIQNPSTGCWSDRVSLTITVTPADTFNARGNGIVDSINVCSNGPMTLSITNISNIGQTGGAFNSFTWSSPSTDMGFTTLTNGTGSQTITPIAAAGGVYTLTATATNGATNPCRNVKFLKVNVQTNPFLNGAAFITTVPNPVCIGVPVTHTLFLSNPNGTLPNYTPTLGNNGRPLDNYYSDLDTVIIGSSINVSGCMGVGSTTAINGLPASAPSLYNNYTGLGTFATLQGGTSVPYKMTIMDSLYTWSTTYYYYIYIDYNRNGTFELPGEMAVTTNISYSPTSTCTSLQPGVSGSFTVPTNVSSGPTLCRVISSTYYNIGGPTSTGAAGTYYYGETEDYIVNLIGLPDTTYTKLQWRSSATGTTILGTDNKLIHNLINSPSYYTVKMTNGVCVDSVKDTVTNNVAAFAATAITGPASMCAGETMMLSVSSSGGCIPHSYNWSVASGAGTFTAVPGGSLNNDSVMFTPSGAGGTRTVNLTITDNNSTTPASLTRTLTFAFNNPTPTSLIPDTICGLQSAILCATPSVTTDVIKWYTSANSLSPIYTGNCLTTPVLNAQTVYWARQFTSVWDSIMPYDLTGSSGGPYSITGLYGERIAVSKRSILQAVDIVPYGSPGATATVDIALYDLSGNEVQSTGSISYVIPSTNSTTGTTNSTVKIPVGFTINPGGYRLFIKSYTVATGFAYIFYGTSPYPFTTAGGGFSIIEGCYSTTTSYPNYKFTFYGFDVEEGCWGASYSDTVKYVSPPALSISRGKDSICSGSSTTPVTITSTLGNYQSYTWNPSANIGGTPSAGFVFSEPIVGNYTYVLNAVQTSGLQCAATDTFRLKVKSIPSPITKNPAVTSMDICNGTVVPMDASSGVNLAAKVGTGTVTSNAGVASPFYIYYEDQRVQYIYLASELTALGFSAGNLDSLGVIITANSSTYTQANTLTVRIGHTTSTSLTGYLAQPSLSVYSAAFVYPTSFPTTKDIAFSSPFYWNGTDNILIEMCYDHNAWTTPGVSVEGTTQSANRSWGQYTDGITACSGLTSGSSNTFRPNMFFYQKLKSPITWSPTTRLFNSASLSPAYAGTARDSVWAAPQDTVKYIITATHSNGCAIQDSITINVLDSLTITSQPAAITRYCIGDTISLSVGATSTSPIIFTWRKNGVPINKTTNPSAGTANLMIPITALADSGLYDVSMTTGSICGTKLSSLASVKVRTNPVITTQPVGSTVCVGTAFNFNVATVNDSNITWHQIGGAGNTGAGNSRSVTASAYSDSGKYYFTVRGFAPCKVITSDTIQVNVLPPAQIATQPAALTTLCVGQSATLTPTATGALGYQWTKDGVAITSATSLNYTVTANSQADSGVYRLIVKAPQGCTDDTTSISAGIVKVNLPVSITTQPPSLSEVCEGSTYNTCVTAVNNSGYEWYKDGTAISPSSTGTCHQIVTTALSDAGRYKVLVKGLTSCPDVFSTEDTMSVIPLARVTTQPVADTACEGQTLSIGVTGNSATIGYQWLKNGSPNGVTTNPLVISNAQMSDSAMYSCILISAKSCKTDTSIAVVGAVLRQVVINTQPIASDMGCLGVQYCLSVSASNTSGYAWYHNGSAISPTVNSNTLCFNPFAMTDTGQYYVQVSGNGPCPMVTSNTSNITYTYPADITANPAANTDVCAGNTLTLNVTASNVSTYKWYKGTTLLTDGGNVSGATTNSLSIANTTTATAGTYKVVAVGINGCTNDTSSNAVVTISTPLTFTAPLPISRNLCEAGTINESVSMSGSTSGSGSYVFSWTHNGTALASTTNNYTKSSITQAADAGRYIVRVAGAASCAAVYDTIDITVNKSPVITTQPNGTSPICLGSTLSISAAASNTSGIDWYKTGNTTPIQTNSTSPTTYTKTNTTTTDAGTYYVIAKPLPACAQVTSNTVAVVINNPVVISTHPQGANLLENPAGSWTMTVAPTSTSTGPFTYQWRKNGVNISGATNSSYSITNYVELAHKGNYDCIIRTGAPCNNADTSNIAVIGTTKCPIIQRQPRSTVNICKGTSFSLDITAIGAKSYQWYKDGVAISKANAANYSINSATPAHSGTYVVEAIAYNPAICTPVFSDTVKVTVQDQPVITQQPLSNASCGAQTHTMTVAALYAENYQWYKNGVAISPNGTSSSYTYNGVNAIGDQFYVEVSNALCPTAQSNTVMVKSINPANRVKLATSSVYDLVERCTDNNGWTYYATTSQSDDLLLAIKRDATDMSVMAKPDIELTRGIREISPINSENRGAILGSRLFNLDFTSVIKKPYEVKFYFSDAEESAVMTRWRDIRRATGSLFTTNRQDTITFITSTQNPFTNSLWENITIPLNFDNTIAHTDREFGKENNVKYVIIKRLIATRSGGTMFMDYSLKTTSGVSNVTSNGFGVNLYPVPSNDGKITVEVSSKRMKPIHFVVTDMTGRVIAKFEEKHLAKESKHDFDFSSFANGNYQIHVANDEESMTGKFTISK